MRYPPLHRSEARARIVNAAAHAIRERGLADPSVSDIMGRAGLTHGAFYHHFANRDALLAEAVLAAAAETGDRVFAGDADRASMLHTYCSPDHAEAPVTGCVLAAVGTEAAHCEAAPVRSAFATAARGFIKHVDRVLRASNAGRRETNAIGWNAAGDEADDEALLLASRMVGAVILARLVGDRQLAARILEVARR